MTVYQATAHFLRPVRSHAIERDDVHYEVTRPVPSDVHWLS